MIIHKPASLSSIEAAGVPENWMTAFQAIFLEGNFKKGDNVLIHAGASGVGVAAIQLARKSSLLACRICFVSS
jgi:NADPH:quinone reductase-like Zn-dependent oxidoreductase